jgi:hypothetical protein
MNIQVNDRVVDVFSGARVADALRAYSRVTWKQVQNGSKVVLDGAGHEVALDGALAQGSRLQVKRAARRGGRA